jgi:hypothetical protein
VCYETLFGGGLYYTLQKTVGVHHRYASLHNKPTYVSYPGTYPVCIYLVVAIYVHKNLGMHEVLRKSRQGACSRCFASRQFVDDKGSKGGLHGPSEEVWKRGGDPNKTVELSYWHLICL